MQIRRCWNTSPSINMATSAPQEPGESVSPELLEDLKRSRAGYESQATRKENELNDLMENVENFKQVAEAKESYEELNEWFFQRGKGKSEEICQIVN